MAIYLYKMEITVNQHLNMSLCSLVPTVSNDAVRVHGYARVPGMTVVTGSILVTGEQTSPLG